MRSFMTSRASDRRWSSRKKIAASAAVIIKSIQTAGQHPAVMTGIQMSGSKRTGPSQACECSTDD
jgi:hypothetical protein